ncbi:MAG: hypothetical protein WCT39_03090 [Candidatus Margulisiibacteriota bacterium]
MGISLVLVIGLGLVAVSCAGANRVSPPVVNVAEERPDPLANEAETVPTEPIFPQVYVEVTQIDDIETALEVITTPSVPEEPMIVAFGELHENCMASEYDNLRCMSFETTARHMANEIFPLLSRPAYGEIHNYVSEFFRNDPVVDQQLADFMQGAVFINLEHLDDFMRGRDFCPVLRMLELASETNSLVYGSHLSLSDLPDLAGFDALYANRGDAVRNMLRDYAYARIVAVIGQGRSISFYGGVDHVAPHPTEAFALRSFGDELAREYENYRAIFIVVPEVAERNLDNPALIRLGDWRTYIPQEGITFIRTEVAGVRSMYYIFYPVTQDVRELTRNEVYSCQQASSGQ